MFGGLMKMSKHGIGMKVTFTIQGMRIDVGAK